MQKKVLIVDDEAAIRLFELQTDYGVLHKLHREAGHRRFEVSGAILGQHRRPQRRLHNVLPRPVRRRAQRLAIQDLRNVRCQQPARVEPLIHNRRLLPQLRIEIPVERRVSAKRRIRHVHIGHLAARHLIHLAPVAFNPRQVP